jgi:hypothetical protein
MVTYRGNRVVVGLFALLAAGSAFLVWMSLNSSEPDSPGDYRIYVVIALLLAAYAFWTFKKMVTLHSEGIIYQNLAGEKQMRWDEVEKFFYSATKRSVNLIPVGTYYSYKLVDGQNKTITLGNGIERTKELGLKIIELTQASLLKKTSHQFDSGVDVDFGYIKLSRTKGLTIRKLFGGWKSVPLGEIRKYSIQMGQFCVWGANDKLLGAAGVPNIPNVFVLKVLLDVIFAPKTKAAQAP